MDRDLVRPVRCNHRILILTKSALSSPGAKPQKTKPAGMGKRDRPEASLILPLSLTHKTASRRRAEECVSRQADKALNAPSKTPCVGRTVDLSKRSDAVQEYTRGPAVILIVFQNAHSVFVGRFLYEFVVPFDRSCTGRIRITPVEA